MFQKLSHKLLRGRKKTASAHCVDDEVALQPLPEPQPINPEEIEDVSRTLGRIVTAAELPEIRRRLDIERNVNAGLRGQNRDITGEIREEHRAKIERGEVLLDTRPTVREQRGVATAKPSLLR
jgi:hypothetical protein